MRYEIIEHTGDVGVIVFGSTYEVLYKEAVYAMADLILDIEKLTPNVKTSVELQADSPESLMVDILSEVIYFLEADDVLYFNSDIDYNQETNQLKATLEGAPVPDNPDYKYVIKAPTYHMIKVSPKEGYARIIFDV